MSVRMSFSLSKKCKQQVALCLQQDPLFPWILCSLARMRAASVGSLWRIGLVPIQPVRGGGWPWTTWIQETHTFSSANGARVICQHGASGSFQITSRKGGQHAGGLGRVRFDPCLWYAKDDQDVSLTELSVLFSIL